MVVGREKALAGAITGGFFQNDVDVTIGKDAIVDVGLDLTLESDASVPWYAQYVWDSKNNSVENYMSPAIITDRFNYNLGIQNGLVTSWAEAIAAADEDSLGVMFNVLITDSSNYVTIEDGAMVTVTEKAIRFRKLPLLS